MENDILLFLLGLLVGAMNAVAGGGLIVALPIMISLGIPPIVASATGAVATAPGQLAAAIGYRKYLRRVSPRYILLLIPMFIGSVAGALVLRETSPDNFAQLLPALILVGLFLFAFQPLMHFHLHSHLKGRARSFGPLVLLGIAMLPVSFYAAYFGPGFGFLMLAFLGFAKIQDTHMINAMKNVSAVFIATIIIICLFGTQLIDWRTGALMAIGSTVGGYLGVHYALKVSSRWMRIIISFVGLLAVFYMVLNPY
jgi:uncharacterized membrane protein YfcA